MSSDEGVRGESNPKGGLDNNAIVLYYSITMNDEKDPIYDWNLGRPIKTASEVLHETQIWLCVALLKPKEFIRLIRERYGYRMPRRTLQLYSSPQLKLMPLPIHRGGHRSYYLHPEHTLRLAAILAMKERHFFPLSLIAEVMRRLPERYHYLISEGLLAGPEIKEFLGFLAKDWNLRDFLYRKVCRVLETIEQPYWEAQSAFEYQKQVDRYVTKALLRENCRLASWLKKGQGVKMGYAYPKGEVADLAWARHQREAADGSPPRPGERAAGSGRHTAGAVV